MRRFLLLRFLLSLELGSNLLYLLLTLAFLHLLPKQITYQYLNRKARRSRNISVIVVFYKCIYFFPACLFLTALNIQQNHVITPSTSLAAEAPHRAAWPGWHILAGPSVRWAGSARDGISHTHCRQHRELCLRLGRRQMQRPLYRNAWRGKSYIRRAEMHFVVRIVSSWRAGIEGRRTPQLQWLLPEVSPVLFFLWVPREILLPSPWSAVPPLLCHTSFLPSQRLAPL